MTLPARRPPARHSPAYNPNAWQQRDGRRHLTGTPGFDWATADRLPELGPYELPEPPRPTFPPPGETVRPADSETTGEFPVAALRADWDPTPTGPLRLWEHSGPLPILPPPRDDDPPSLRWAWAAGFYLLLAFGAALVAVQLLPPT